MGKINYYLAKTGCTDSGIIADYEKNVVKPAELVRMVVLKLRRNGRIDPDDTIRLLNSITKSETEIVEKILDLK